MIHLQVERELDLVDAMLILGTPEKVAQYLNNKWKTDYTADDVWEIYIQWLPEEPERPK